jgi:hypothetical protein
MFVQGSGRRRLYTGSSARGSPGGSSTTYAPNGRESGVPAREPVWRQPRNDACIASLRGVLTPGVRDSYQT